MNQSSVELRPELCIDDREPPPSADVALSTCTSSTPTLVSFFGSRSGVQPNALQVAKTTFWRSSMNARTRASKNVAKMSSSQYLCSGRATPHSSRHGTGGGSGSG